MIKNKSAAISFSYLLIVLFLSILALCIKWYLQTCKDPCY